MKKYNFSSGILCALVSLSTLITNAQTYKWGNVAMGGGGFVSGIVTCPTERNLIYARTDVGGAYRWEEAGKRWIPLLDFIGEDEKGYQGVEAIAIDPQETNKVYMLVGTDYYNNGKTAIIRSSDYGTTWLKSEVTNQFKTHGNGRGRQNGERLVVDPHNGRILFCGTRRDGLFKSVDGGATWAKVNSFPAAVTANGNGLSFVLFGREGVKGQATPTIYVGVSRLNAANMYQSTDGGATWRDITPNQNFMPQRASLSTDGKLYVAEGNGCGPGAGGAGEPLNNGAIYQMDIRTGVWRNISPVAYPYGGISVDETNPRRLIASTINRWMNQPWGNGDRFFLSEDGGATWTDLIGRNLVTMNENGSPWIKDHAMHWAGSINFDPYNGRRVFVTSGNGIFCTDNVSANTNHTWNFTAKGLEETVPNGIYSLDNGTLFTCIGDYDGWLHPNINVSPLAGTFNPKMGTTIGITVADNNQNRMARVGSRIYYSTNGGTSWNGMNKPAGVTAEKGKLAYSADGSALLWCPEAVNAVYRTVNNGTNWTQVNGVNFNSIPVGDARNPNKFYIFDGGSGNFYVSTDGGANFNRTVTLNGGSAELIRSVPYREGDVWVPLNNNGLTRSTNSGSSFTKINGVTRCTSVGFGKAPAGRTFPTVYIWGTVNGVIGIHRSDNEGATWLRVNDNLHQFGGPGNGNIVNGDMTVYGRVYMSSVGRGVIVGEIYSGTVTDLENVVDVALNHSKATCYPNPFTGQFTIQSKGAFSYTIYDLTGIEIEKGNAEESISLGSNLTSGIYVVKIQNQLEKTLMKVVKQ